MHEESSYTASIYISIILAFYTIGMIILLVHFVKQKYGQVSVRIPVSGTPSHGRTD